MSVLLSVCSQAHIGPALQPKMQEDAATRAHRPLSLSLSLFRAIQPRTNNICQVDNKPDFLVTGDDKSAKHQFH